MPPLPFFTDSLRASVLAWSSTYMIDIIIIINSSSLLMKSNRGQKLMFDLWFRFVVSFCHFLNCSCKHYALSNKIIINYNQPQLKLKSAVLNTLQSSVVTNTNARIFINCNSSCSSQRCEQNTEFLSATFLVSKIMHYPLARV